MESVKQTMTGTSSPEHCKSDQMKAVTWHGAKNIKVECVPKPKIEKGSDIIVKVTACSICPGFATQASAGDIPGMEKGQILGREAVGIIDQVGGEIVKFKEGDRVVVSFVIACGECSFCKRGEFSGCNQTNESKDFADMYGGWAPAAVFGYSKMLGSLPGSNAQYVRVPYGDVNCYKVPNGVPDEKALYCAETVVSGLHAADLGCVKENDIVVIWGLGPVGIMAALWCKMKGAKRVIGVDHMSDRLKFAYDQFKLEVVDRSDISSTQLQNKLLGMLPNGGADVVIDACGFTHAQGMMKRLEQSMGMQKESSDILTECMTVARKFGRVVIIADYAGYADSFPIGHLMMKHLTLSAGQTPVQKYFKPAMDAIEAGELDPSLLISHHASFDDIPDMYMHLSKKEKGYMKIFCRPSQE